MVSQAEPEEHLRSVFRAVVQSKAQAFEHIKSEVDVAKRVVDWVEQPKHEGAVKFLLEHYGGRINSKEELIKVVRSEADDSHDLKKRNFLLLYLIPLSLDTRILIFRLRKGASDVMCSDTLLYKATLECPDLKLLFAVNNPSENTTFLLQYVNNASGGANYIDRRAICPIPEAWNGSIYTLVLENTTGLWNFYNRISAIGCVGGSRTANKEADTAVTYTFTDKQRKIFRKYKAQISSANKWRMRKARKQEATETAGASRQQTTVVHQEESSTSNETVTTGGEPSSEAKRAAVETVAEVSTANAEAK